MLASVENFALFVHLVGAFLFVGGALVAAIAFEAARRRARPDEIALLLGLTRVGVLLVGVGALPLILSGLSLVGLEDVGYGATWIVAAIALFVTASALGAHGGRRPKQARLLATRLAREGREETPELRALLDDRASRAANYLSGLLVLVILALMVFQPE